MKIQSSLLRNSLLLVTSVLALTTFRAAAQSKPNSAPAAQAKADSSQASFPAAKAQSVTADSAAPDADTENAKNRESDKDSADAIRKREEWFHKQRASANGHIPSGAHRRALEHMQGMMEKEGKLIRRADGTIQEVSPQGFASTTAWSPIGPSPTSGGFFSPVTGRITTIAIDPTDATGNTVLIGGAQGGIWRTTDAGATWGAVGDQNVSLSMGSIAFAPSMPTTVYAGTGEQASIGVDIYYGEGVLKSTNGGQTWTPTCTIPSATCPFIGPFNDITPFEFFTLGGARISYVSVNPSNPQMVLVSAQFATHGNLEGVYCSADGGGTWTNVLPGQMSTFVGFASSTVAFATLADPFGTGTGTNPNGIYKSTNANSVTSNSCSMTFSPVTGATLPASSTMGRIDLGISPNFATDNTVYASIADSTTASSTNLGVWVTTNGGTSWTQTAAPDICKQQCWYDNVIKVDPIGGGHAFFGGSSVSDNSGAPAWVIRTTNGGTSWSSIIPNIAGGSAGLPHVDNHAMVFIKLASGKVRMYLGNDGGIWRTDDAEATSVAWTNLNDSILQLTQFYPDLSVHPSSPNIAFAGAQDNGSQIYAGVNNWTDNNVCGDGTGTAIDNVVPSTVYVTCNGNNIAASSRNGAAGTYLAATNGINLNDAADFVPPLVTDPGTANTVYTGTTKVYQTLNGGISWVALSGDLVNGANADNLTAMVVAPKNSAVVYAGADTGQVFVATNVGAGAGTFGAVAGQASLPPRRVTAIAVDSADATGKTAYAAFSGFAFIGGTVNDPIGHLFKTVDGGATWKDISCTVANCSTPAATDLPNTPVNSVVIDPNVARTLYVGTDIGVFQGTCTTTCSWTTLSTGLPRVAVLSLRLHAASRTLIATTHGRGAWNLLLSNFAFPGPHVASLSQVSANAGAAGFTLTVNGNGLTNGAIQFGGTALTPTGSQSDTSLSGSVLASQIAGAGTPQVTVKVGATTSNGLTFTVLGAAPTITSDSPTSASVNAAATQITVTGTGFASNSTVLMNPDVGGTAIATTFVNSTTLHATVPATFMAGFGSTNSVGVRNPAPGGGTTLTTSTVTLPTFTVTAPAPTNDNFASAMTVTPGSGGAFTDTKDSSGATTQSTDPIPACAQNVQIPFVTGISNTIWYKFTPAANGTITDVDTIGSSYDTVLSIWTGSSGSLTAVPNACNDDINPGIVIQSQIQNLNVTAGTTYFIMVSSFGPADPNPIALGGKSVFNLTFASSATAPSITSLTPNSGPVGTSVTIAGANFGATQGTSTVTFNGTAATVASAANWSATSIVVPVPTGATTGPVVVTVGGAASNGVTFTVNASGGTFTLAATNTSVTTTAGAAGTMASTTSTITVTPSGGFSGAITLTCPSNAPVSLPPGVTCSGTIPAGSTSGTLTVNLLDPSAMLTVMAPPAAQNLWAANTPAKPRFGNGWWTLSAGTGFAALLLLCLPGRKRYRAALGLGLVCVLSFTLGCSNNYGGGGGGPVATITHMSVNNSKLASNDPTGFRFTVNITSSAAANGSVQLFDGTATLGSPVSASNGTATISSAGLAQGTHLITAHYLGDTSTQASQSGTLYVTVTTPPAQPPTTVPVTGTSGSTTSTTTFNLTIN
jgi:Bacterial Ig-like domain (group 3)/IPT/TIG domain